MSMTTASSNDTDRGRLDALFAQALARIVEQRAQAVALERLGIDLEDEMGTAPEVEAEGDLLGWQPAGHGGELGGVRRFGNAATMPNRITAA
jgi:hypothetical protein